MQKVSLMLMVVVFSTFFTTFSHTRIHDEHTHKHVTFFQWDAGRVKCLPPIEKKQQKKEAEKTANCESIFDFTQLEMSQMKFCALVRIFFRFQPSLHWCPVFSGFFLANETLGPLLARAGSYISLESFLVLREKETHEHKPTANIACDINEGKRKIKSNSCVRFARSALAAVSREFFLTVLLMSC